MSRLCKLLQSQPLRGTRPGSVEACLENHHLHHLQIVTHIAAIEEQISTFSEMLADIQANKWVETSIYDLQVVCNMY